MENNENMQSIEESVYNDKQINRYLLETAKWGKFLAIMGYIGMGILVLVALGVMVASTVASQFVSPGFPMILVGGVYLILAAVYYFPVTYLYRFAKRIKDGITAGESKTLTSGFENLKSLFKFMGIFTIVILSIYALALIIVLPLTLILAN